MAHNGSFHPPRTRSRTGKLWRMGESTDSQRQCHQCGRAASGIHCPTCTALLPEHVPATEQGSPTRRHLSRHWIMISLAALAGLSVLYGIAARVVTPEPQELLVGETAALVDSQFREIQQGRLPGQLRRVTEGARSQLNAVEESLRTLPSDDGTRKELDALRLLVSGLAQLHESPRSPDWSRLHSSVQTGMVQLPPSVPLSKRITSVGAMVIDRLSLLYSTAPAPPNRHALRPEI